MFLLTEYRHEPLFALATDEEMVYRAGFPNYQDFRHWWKMTHRGRFAPMQMVQTWRVRRPSEEDIAAQGARLVADLYGPLP